jgi:hypothetical protein
VAAVGDYFADLLRPRWVSGLNKVTTPSFKGIEPWLLGGSYSWVTSPAGSVSLDVTGAESSLADAVASEVARFSCAAYEALLDANPDGHAGRALGWALVRHYYATFYAAHALLRLSGSAVTMISVQTATKLNTVGGQYLGVSPQLTGGPHLVRIAQSDPSKVQISKIGGGSGGSHEDMWKLFLDLVADIEGQLVLTQGQSQEALAAAQLLTEFRRQLCKQGKSNGAWLSTVRNNLNYRQDYGVWYPYSVTEKFATNLLSRMSRWRPGHLDGYDIGRDKGELACFVDGCNVMAQLLTAALKDLAQRSEKSGSGFVDRQPFKLLRLTKLAV